MPFPWPRSLRFRLIVTSMLVEAAVLGVLIANSVRLIDNAAHSSIEAIVAQTTPMLNAALLPYLLQRDYAGLQDFLAVAVSEHDRELVYLSVSDTKGRRVAQAGLPFDAPLPALSDDLDLAIRQGAYHIERPVTLAGQRLGQIRLGISTRIIATTRADLVQQGILIATAALGLSMLLLGGIGIWLTRSLQQAAKASRAVAAGDFSQRLPESGALEVAELAATINHMSAEVRTQLDAIRASEQEFRIQFELAGVGIGHLLANGHWLRSNHRLNELLGYSALPLPDLEQLCHPTDLPAMHTAIAKVSAGDVAGWQAEQRYRSRAGDYVWCLCTVSAYRAAGGELAYLLVVLQDLGQLKAVEEELKRYRDELELRVAQRTLALSAANQELEKFSYSVSHDLRSPLRGIAGFAQMLQEDHGDRLPEEARGYLARITRATQRMGALIDGLLALSQVSRGSLVPRQVDLALLAMAVIEDLRGSQPERQVEVRIENALPDLGDWAMLQALIQNLLGNAWKYTAKRAQARIEFGRERVGEEWVYFVRDNGAGFDQDHAVKLFGAFQRLHSADEFEGCGIGLATAARIVHRHGGRIWAEGSIGQGATFYFTLAVAPLVA
ncbi:PAS domain S-box protein [Chitinimonas arctica]|uniref:histidine kinase n=1 Tax=Chitinimonas arctica TaxID=2594795 RepID=A0A516SIC1_9NEIS|nr:ATP-binding protein [Chitinimonas arctica]QDQ27895.1 PAS domain S-box protein [Chitinimonas arctica]